MKARYDKSVSRQAEFQVGDKVMLRNTVISKDEKRKLRCCLPPGGSKRLSIWLCLVCCYNE
ncbi:unnamed protein product [Clavelina lepadiformis]|uniref:Uncharacterized protein n=1 Tax=Clavelina lepadiformis TaxID=159417 RepID=A0ABP0GL66_CLALP